MANKSGGNSKVGQASRYKTNKIWERNRTRKLKRLIASQPNNEQLVKALGNIYYRRKTPTNRVWSSTMISQAKLFKMFCGSVDMNMFSKNEKLSAAALLAKGPYSNFKVSASTTGMFSLGTRARWVQ